MIFAPNLREVHGWLRKLHVHIFHLPNNDLRNSEIPEPIVVRRDNEPWSVFGAGLVKRIFIGLRVTIPIFAFLIVGFTDLPLTRRFIQSLLKPGKLFLLLNV